MSNVTWSNDVSGDFGTAADWVGGIVPTSSSNVTINTTSIENITFQSGDDFAVNSLTVGADNFAMSGGTLSIAAAASFAGEFSLSNGTMTVGGGATFTDGFYQDGGKIEGAGAVAISGFIAPMVSETAFFQGGSAEGTLQFTNNGTVSVEDYTFGGSTQLINNGVVSDIGVMNLGDSTGTNASITNESGGTFSIDDEAEVSEGASGVSFTNAGILEKLAGTGTSNIGVSISSTGTIDVASGTLAFSGPTSTFGGTIEGAGTFEIAEGYATILGSATLTAANFTISGLSFVSVEQDMTYAGAFSLGSGASLYLNGGSLTLSGSAQLDSAINGSGTLITSGSVSVPNSGFTLANSVAWQNSGTVMQSGTLSFAHTPDITNEVNGVYTLTNDSGIGGANFVNEGTFTITAGTGTSDISAPFASTGTINVTSGTAEFSGPENCDSFGGTIEGAGTWEISGGYTQLESNTAVTVDALTIDDSGNLTLDGNLTYAGKFSLVSGASVDLGGRTLTLSGGHASLSGTIDGGGALITSSSVSVTGFTLAGATTWQNNGTVLQSVTTALGNGSLYDTEIINEANGVFHCNSGSGISSGTYLYFQFVNDGILTITAGTRISQIDPVVTSTGTIDVVSGTAQFDGFGNVLGGTIEGAGTIQLASGSDTISSGAKLTVADLAIDSGASVTLAENLSYAGGFSIENASSPSSLALDGYTLTLTGKATLDGVSIVGSGKLVTKGTTDLEGVSFGAAVTWDNEGRVYQSANLNLGTSGKTTTKIINEAGSVYELTADVSIGSPNNYAEKLYNEGTLEKTAGSSISTIYGSIENSGTLYAASGTLDITGAVTGTGKLKIGAGDILEFSGSVGSKQALTFSGSGGELELTDSPAFAATIAGFAAKDSIDLSNFDYSASEKLSFTENSARTNGELVIKDGTESFSVELFGQYIAADFKLAADGSGSVITYVPPGSHSTTPHLAAAHT